MAHHNYISVNVVIHHNGTWIVGMMHDWKNTAWSEVCPRLQQIHTHSISLVSWPVLTWSHWQGINRKPHDATWAATAERHLISLRVSPVHAQACGELSVTHLKAEFPKAPRLQLLSFVWKLVYQYTSNLGCSLDPDPFRGIRAGVAGDWIVEEGEKSVGKVVATRCSSWESCSPVHLISGVSHDDCSITCLPLWL